MSPKLVSLLTPCFNTGGYIHRLLDSVLAQSYPAIEMVVVDDGSSDNSREVVSSYIDRFAARGYSLQLVSQPNQGQSVAINNGLKLIHGDYLAWPDSDDYYASNLAIEKMVTALENEGVPFRMVRTREVLVSDPELKPLTVVGVGRPYKEATSLFEDCLLHLNDYYFYPGAYMVDVEALREVTDMEIYTNREAGQNWQLMLPMLHRYRCLTLPEELYHVLTRASSHSRGAYVGLEREMLKNDAYEDVLIHTVMRLKGMSDSDKEETIRRVRRKYDMCRLSLALTYKSSPVLKKAMADLKRHGFPLPLILDLKCRLIATRLGGWIYRFND